MARCLRFLLAPVWAEADAVHRPTVSVEDLGLTGRLLVHDPLQHVVRLFVNQIQVCRERSREDAKAQGVSQRFSAQRSEIHKPPSGAVPPADLTLRSFFGVTLHTRTVESAKPPAIRLESSVKSTAVRPCGGEAKSFFPHLELGKYTS